MGEPLYQRFTRDEAEELLEKTRILRENQDLQDIQLTPSQQMALMEAYAVAAATPAPTPTPTPQRRPGPSTRERTLMAPGYALALRIYGHTQEAAVGDAVGAVGGGDVGEDHLLTLLKKYERENNPHT